MRLEVGMGSKHSGQYSLRLLRERERGGKHPINYFKTQWEIKQKRNKIGRKRRSTNVSRLSAKLAEYLNGKGSRSYSPAGGGHTQTTVRDRGRQAGSGLSGTLNC